MVICRDVDRPAAAAPAKSLQSCLTLYDPIDGSPPGCHFLLQCMKVKSESEVAQSCPTLCDAMDSSPLAPLPAGFSRQEWVAIAFSKRCVRPMLIKIQWHR